MHASRSRCAGKNVLMWYACRTSRVGQDPRGLELRKDFGAHSTEALHNGAAQGFTRHVSCLQPWPQQKLLKASPTRSDLLLYERGLTKLIRRVASFQIIELILHIDTVR